MIEAERLKGMLWGLVVGDCLGSPIQFTQKDRHREIRSMEAAIGVYGVDLPPGYWTDDSSMAFCVMESLVRLGRYDRSDIARNFVRWLDDGFMSSWDGGAFDIGNATRHALQGLRAGKLKNGSPSSQGNGSIMRFAPGFIWGRFKNIPRIDEEISDLTHNSSAIRGLIKRMGENMETLLHGRMDGIATAHTRLTVPNSGWAFDTYDAAIWALASHKGFHDGMLEAVNLGGDSDSIGAVYGQLAGAFYGFSAIPREWVTAVKNWRWVDGFIDTFLAKAMGNA